MKDTFRFVFATVAWLALTPVGLRAQDVVPNGGFETWLSGEPTDWITGNVVFPGGVTQTSDAHSGSWAVQGNTVEVYPGFYGAAWLQTELYPGFPVTQRWTAVHGFYKLISVSSDFLYVTAFAFRNGLTVGAGAFTDSVSAGSYTELVVPIQFIDSLPPDSISIYVTMGPGGASESLHPGSSYKLDDLTLAMDSVSSCPVALTGDADASGEVKSSDIIYLVNYVLKAGPEPVPCPAAGDANGDGEVKTSDIIYVVNYVLKAGPAPVDVCTLIPGTWTCP
jgi:hypothetical protein